MSKLFFPLIFSAAITLAIYFSCGELFLAILAGFFCFIVLLLLIHILDEVKECNQKCFEEMQKLRKEIERLNQK